MLNYSNTASRYSDKDLAEFKNRVEEKLASAVQQLNDFLERIENTSEAKNNDGDWMDDTSNAQDLEMLYSMATRQRKHVRDLENALIRIHNKNYGICVVTGNLIDKRRLLAVPTTSKCLEAKIIQPSKEKPNEIDDETDNIIKPKVISKPKIITKIIKKPLPIKGNQPPRDNVFDDIDDDDNVDDVDDVDDNDFGVVSDNFDFDQFSNEIT